MEQVYLDAQIRKETGTSPMKKLRATDVIPAVVYKKGETTLNIRVNRRDLLKILHTSAGENVIVNLKIQEPSQTKGASAKPKEKTVIIKEIQHHPFKGEILHIDFQQISLTEVIKVNVPVVAKGESVGVKQDGGVLEYILREIEVECLPTQIPEKIEVDVTALKIGDSLLVKDLPVISGVKILNDTNLTVISIAAPIKVEEIVAAPAAEAEVMEPEVIKQKKPEELAEEAQSEEKKEPKKKEE